MNDPSTNGANGRDAATGRFLAGNSGGPGNPYAERVAALRSASSPCGDRNGWKQLRSLGGYLGGILVICEHLHAPRCRFS